MVSIICMYLYTYTVSRSRLLRSLNTLYVYWFRQPREFRSFMSILFEFGLGRVCVYYAGYASALVIGEDMPHCHWNSHKEYKCPMNFDIAHYKARSIIKPYVYFRAHAAFVFLFRITLIVLNLNFNWLFNDYIIAGLDNLQTRQISWIDTV